MVSNALSVRFTPKKLQMISVTLLKSVSFRNTLLTSEVECQGEILGHASVQIKVLEPCHFRRLIELSNDINLTLSIYLWFISRVIHAKM